MYEKNGKYFADWYDKDGKRKRKSFTSKRAALKHESEMAALARPKGKPQGKRSGASLRHMKDCGTRPIQSGRLELLKKSPDRGW